MDIKLTHSCFDHSPVVPKSRQGWTWQGYLDQFDTLVIQQLNSVMTGHQLLCSDPLSVFSTLTPECRNCPQLRNRLPICHVSPLCFGALDLHLLDFNRRTHLAIGIPFAELGQGVGHLSL